MSISSCDIGNPIYNKQQPEPTFETDSFIEFLEDENGKKWQTKIDYSGFYYDSAFRLTELKVQTKMPKLDYIEEDVKECISLRENKRVVVECQIEIV